MVADDLVQTRLSTFLRVEVAQGSDWTDEWALQEADNAEPDTPLDLTGKRIQCALRRSVASGEPVEVTFDSLMGDFVISDAASGMFHASVLGHRFNAYSPGEYFATWRLLWGNEAREFARGPFIILPARY